MVRWHALERVVPWLAGAAATIGSARALAGRDTGVSLGLSLVASVAVPGFVGKILWDRSQKRRQRERLAELERKISELEGRVLELTHEKGKLEGQMVDRGGRR